ncbi:MAG: sulfurtransferase [Pirellulaceae bacterium]
MTPVVNIAAYRFGDLTDLRELRSELKSLCQRLELRGTILLSEEGINLFVAGTRSAVDALLSRLRQIPALADLEAKESYSRSQPFHRMLVKIKREIIAFGVPGIDPRRYTSRRLPAGELKRWLDEGRPVVLLDVRNDFEVEAGTFHQAKAIGIEDFRHFPAAVERLRGKLPAAPIVTFCTGGIRCEKAAPYLERSGFADVYQLEGGILKYFEECGGQHFHGECFVFDQRVTLDPRLQEGGWRQCFACQALLSATDLVSPHYVLGQSCPHCHADRADREAEQLAEREAAVRRAANPLPGSVPYDNVRPLSVPARCDGMELLAFLAALPTHLTSDQWRAVCAAGRLICRGEAVQPGRVVRAGERLLHAMPATVEPAVRADIEILHEDEALVVVHKPAPLPMHPCGRFHRNTLSYLLHQAYAPLRLRPAHRLDADTSGVVVLAKSRRFAALLQPQFQLGQVSKVYWALVRGVPPEPRFECHAPVASLPVDAGLRLPDPAGSPASTHFRILADGGDGTTLLEVRPLTGRTNQIRAHLWSLGLPIVGDPFYLGHHQVGTAMTRTPDDPPLCLHALSLELTHPLTRRRVLYTTPRPTWSQRER